MNRPQRRAAGQRQCVPGLPDLAQVVACPDCNADVTITEIAPGVLDATVAHDDTCPWYGRLTSSER